MNEQLHQLIEECSALVKEFQKELNRYLSSLPPSLSGIHWQNIEQDREQWLHDFECFLFGLPPILDRLDTAIASLSAFTQKNPFTDIASDGDRILLGYIDFRKAMNLFFKFSNSCLRQSETVPELSEVRSETVKILRHAEVFSQLCVLL